MNGTTVGLVAVVVGLALIAAGRPARSRRALPDRLDPYLPTVTTGRSAAVRADPHGRSAAVRAVPLGLPAAVRGPCERPAGRGGRLGCPVGALVRAWRARRRRAAVLAELPVVVRMLALAVIAGEDPVDALDRVARVAGGVLGADLAAVVAAVRTGVPLPAALAELRDRAGVPALARFADGVRAALDGGVPLAGVLRAQAGDIVRNRCPAEILVAG